MHLTWPSELLVIASHYLDNKVHGHAGKDVMNYDPKKLKARPIITERCVTLAVLCYSEMKAFRYLKKDLKKINITETL